MNLADRIAATKPRPPVDDKRPEWVRRARDSRLPARVDYGRTAA